MNEVTLTILIIWADINSKCDLIWAFTNWEINVKTEKCDNLRFHGKRNAVEVL